MDFAVIRLAGKQHVVTEGSVIEVVGDTEKIEVLLTSLGDKITIGTPLVEGVKIKTEKIFEGKGEKIRVAKFKAKSRYRKVMGFRPQIARLKIVSIGEPVVIATPTAVVGKQSSSAKKSPVKKVTAVKTVKKVKAKK